MNQPSQENFSIALKLVVAYFLFFGILDLLWPFLFPGPSSESFPGHYVAFEAQSAKHKAGALLMQRIIGTGYVLAGLSVALRQAWGPGLAYAVLVLAAFASAKDVAWALSAGQPSSLTYGLCLGAFIIWHGILAAVVYRKRRLFSSIK